MENKCSNCRYFEDTNAECRRYPPVLCARPEAALAPTRSQWPSVGPRDWCGEYAQAGRPTLDQQRQDERAMGSEDAAPA